MWDDNEIQAIGKYMQIRKWICPNYMKFKTNGMNTSLIKLPIRFLSTMCQDKHYQKIEKLSV